MRLPGRPPTVAVHILPSVTLPSAAATSDVPSRAIVAASFVLISATLLLIMWQGLLPGLLCVCVGFLATRWLARMLDLGLKRRAGASRAALAETRASSLLKMGCNSTSPSTFLNYSKILRGDEKGRVQRIAA